jgi:cysteine protease ATG4
VREIQQAFNDIVWFTYRRNFSANLASSTFKSDAGWGCMLRTGQMMLFQALKRHRLGSETVFNYAEKTIEPERLRGY